MELPSDFSLDLEWRSERISLGLAIADAKAAALHYINDRHPNATCAFLTGSYATGRLTPASDVDIYILNEIADMPLREMIVMDRYPLQVSIMNTFYLFEWINDSSESDLIGVLPTLIAAGHIFGSEETFLRAKELACSVYSHRSKPRRDMIGYFTSSLLCYYLKLMRPLNALDRADVIIRLVRAASDLVQARAGAKRTGRAQYEVTLKNNSAYSDIISSLPQALSGDNDGITTATWALLAEEGPPVWSTYPDGLQPLFI